MSDPPKTRYAKSGDVHIAYQVLGDGLSMSCMCPDLYRTWNTTGSTHVRRDFFDGSRLSPA
jgi:hypothetical protein